MAVIARHEAEERQQAEAVAFLADVASFGLSRGSVETISTHGATVFLAGDRAYKIKRAVRFPYMDFSTLPRRKAALERELEINRPNAPSLYLGLVPLTRSGDGQLGLGGSGEVVEWVLEMARFEQSSLLSQIARKEGISTGIARALAETVREAHERAPVAAVTTGTRGPAAVVEELAEAFSRLPDPTGRGVLASFPGALRARLERSRAVLEVRARAGLVRRCHGDLHLNNIVLLDGRPVLFDALEFDENLATIDLLYDLAFLLMDLDARGMRAAANIVLNRYLWLRDEPLDLDGLALLPLFLALRAGIRAMIGIGRLDELKGKARRAARAEAVRLLENGQDHLSPPAACLVAVGGLSGTGKSTLAAALAPQFGACPGALHLRSDLERKSLAGVAETSRLPDAAYSREMAATVYDTLAGKARRALRAGHSVIVDAVFLREEERAAIEAVARQTGARFHGLWLTADRATLVARVAARQGDASDATPAVVDLQLSRGTGAVAWTQVDAGREVDETLRRAVELVRSEI
jgi:hypothetical protein